MISGTLLRSSSAGAGGDHPFSPTTLFQLGNYFLSPLRSVDFYCICEDFAILIGCLPIPAQESSLVAYRRRLSIQLSIFLSIYLASYLFLLRFELSNADPGNMRIISIQIYTYDDQWPHTAPPIYLSAAFICALQTMSTLKQPLSSGAALFCKKKKITMIDTRKKKLRKRLQTDRQCRLFISTVSNTYSLKALLNSEM